MEKKRIKAICDAISWIACSQDLNSASFFDATMKAIEIKEALIDCDEKYVAEHFECIANSILFK